VILGRGSPNGDTYISATLVESFRANGVPRQRHLAFLGSVLTSEYTNAGALAIF
jgi:hypothetical protein